MKIMKDSIWRIGNKYYNYFLELSNSRDSKNINFELMVGFGNMLSDITTFCAEGYAQKMTEQQYKDDLKKAVLEYDLFFLEVLNKIPISLKKKYQLTEDEVSVSLQGLIIPYQTNKSTFAGFKVAYLFEQFLEIWEISQEPVWDSVELMEMILSFEGLQEEWYETFLSCIKKLMYVLPIAEQSFRVLKKGLSVNHEILQEEFAECIEHLYLDEGLVNKDYEWIVG